MKIISFSKPGEAFPQLLDFFKTDRTGTKIVVSDAHEITDRDFASGLVNPHAEYVFCAQGKGAMHAMCHVLWGMELFSTDIQLVLQRDIGRDYASTICLQGMDEGALATFVLATEAQAD
ncbi:MAG: hypothetical protein VX730_06875 [Pseudomonadota bacterium]|nr:hypothetical protein [Pseudomonadota bacterium]